MSQKNSQQAPILSAGGTEAPREPFRLPNWVEQVSAKATTAPATRQAEHEARHASASGSTPPHLLPNNAIYVSPKHAAELIDVSLATLWRYAKDVPSFPKPVKLSPGCTRFDRNAILAYVRQRGEASK